MKQFVQKIILSFLYSLIYLAIGLLLAFLIFYIKDFHLVDILSVEGIILVLIGLLMTLKGNPSGINISNIGSENSAQTSFVDNEITAVDRNSRPYQNGFFKNNIVEFGFGNITILLGGVWLVLAALLVWKIG